MSQISLINIEKVSFKYEKEWVLKNINLKVNKKDFIGIVGPNGGGKTTLLKLILKIIKPNFGQIRVNEIIKKDISYVPQYLFFDKHLPITSFDVVMMGLIDELRLFKPFYKSDQISRAKETMSLLKIKDLEKEKFGTLSGGQRQRILIARAIVSQPKLLILDEPTANVDRTTQDLIIEFLYNYNKENTIIKVSHNFDYITSRVNRVICVNKKIDFHEKILVTGKHIESFGKYISKIEHESSCREDK